VRFYILIGLPTETVDDFNMTVDLVPQCSVTECLTSIFSPYPGTDLYRLCHEQKLLPSTITNIRERLEAVIDYPEFSKKQIQKACIWK